MSFAFIKSSAKTLVPVCAALALLSPGAQAESTYGYNAAGAAGATANARVNLQVNVPMLILLRVGSSGATQDTLTLTSAPNPGIPGGIAAAALTNGSNQATGWNGTAPTMTGTTANVTAYAWTNSRNGGSVTGAMTTAFTTGGLTGASINVASSAPVNGGLAHPGANLGTFAAQTFTANSLRSSTWTYSLSTAALASVTAGSHTATVTYTATSL